jgi:hypothetical protein
MFLLPPVGVKATRPKPFAVHSPWSRGSSRRTPQATIEEAELAASALLALTGFGYRDAARTLKAMAETATSRRRTCRPHEAAQ